MRARTLLVLGLLVLAIAPNASRAAKYSAGADRITYATGMSRLSGGTAYASIKLTDHQGVAGSTTPSASNTSTLVGCIAVNRTKGDQGCATVAASTFTIDPLLDKATLKFSVASDAYAGKTLTANITVTGIGNPEPDYGLALPSSTSSPMSSKLWAGRIRTGRVTGTITSQVAGGGALVAYQGPPSTDGMALLFSGVELGSLLQT